MKAVTVAATPTPILPAGKYGFIYIFNNSNQTVFLQFDGSDVGASPTTLATTNGFPLLPNQALILENRIGGTFTGGGSQAIYPFAINGIVSSSTAEVRVQSAGEVSSGI